MRKTTFVIVALCALAAVAGRAADPGPEPPAGMAAELKKLKGTWTVTKAVWGKREAIATPGMTYTFDGDKLVRAVPLGKGAGNQKFKVKLDTEKKPYKITMTPDGGGKAQSAIFKVEKDQLFLATARGRGAKAPADFKGDDVMVLVLTKEKEEKRGNK